LARQLSWAALRVPFLCGLQTTSERTASSDARRQTGHWDRTGEAWPRALPDPRACPSPGDKPQQHNAVVLFARETP